MFSKFFQFISVTLRNLRLIEILHGSSIRLSVAHKNPGGGAAISPPFPPLAAAGRRVALGRPRAYRKQAAGGGLSAPCQPDHTATGLKAAVMADPNSTHSCAQAEWGAVLMNARKELGRSAAIDPRTATDVTPVMTMCPPIRCASLAGTIVAPPRPLKRSPAKASEPC